MFLRKEKRKYKSGNYRMIPFCRDCDSIEVETVQTCKHCGSHNIGYPSFDDMISEDKRGMLEIEKEKDVYIYKCDICGNEFDGIKIPSMVSYEDGEFMVGKFNNEYGTVTEYGLDKDLCNECLTKLTSKLNSEIDNIVNKEHVIQVLDSLSDK